MAKTSRRKFLKLSGIGAAASLPILRCRPSSESLQQPGKKARQFSLGMASYTFREFNLEDTLVMTQRLGLDRITFKDFHLPMESSPEEIKETVAKVAQTGLKLYGGGVIYMRSITQVERAFEYARMAGMEMIIGVPEHELLELVDQKVKEYDIKVAIHNHGPTDKVYPTPESAYKRIKEFDPRLGLCIDIGHTQRAGVDPSEAALSCADRILDVHIKDVSAAAAEGTTIEIGRGVIDIPRFLKTLIKLEYQGTCSFEYEKDGKDPLAGVAESLGYVKGVLAVI